MPEHFDVLTFAHEFVLEVERVIGQEAGLMIQYHRYSDAFIGCLQQQSLEGLLIVVASQQQELRRKHPTSYEDIHIGSLNCLVNSLKVLLTIDQKFNRVAVPNRREAVESIQGHIATFLAGLAQYEEKEDEIADVLGL